MRMNIRVTRDTVEDVMVDNRDIGIHGGAWVDEEQG